MDTPILSSDQRNRIRSFRSRHSIDLLTMLFTDVVDSVKLTGLLGDCAWAAVLERHNAAARDLLEGYPRGEEIKTTGDGFLLVFTRPSEAVEYSLTLQRRLRSLAEETGVPLRVRIGIHVGEVFVEYVNGDHSGKDLLGLQVDITQRVMDLGMGGQILMTRAVYDNGRSMLDESALHEFRDLRWCNHGPYLLKGVDETFEVCEVGEALFAPLAPPAGSAKASPAVPPDRTRRPTLSEEREQLLGRSTSEFMLTLFGFRIFSVRLEQMRTGGLLGNDAESEAYLQDLPLEPFCSVLTRPPDVLRWQAPPGAADTHIMVSRTGDGEVLSMLSEPGTVKGNHVTAEALGMRFDTGVPYTWEVSYRHNGNWSFSNGLFTIADERTQTAFAERQHGLSADSEIDSWSLLLLECGLLLEFGCIDAAAARLLPPLRTDLAPESRLPLLSLLREAYLDAHRRFENADLEDGAELVLYRLTGLEPALVRLSERVSVPGAVAD